MGDKTSREPARCCARSKKTEQVDATLLEQVTTHNVGARVGACNLVLAPKL